MSHAGPKAIVAPRQTSRKTTLSQSRGVEALAVSAQVSTVNCRGARIKKKQRLASAATAIPGINAQSKFPKRSNTHPVATGAATNAQLWEKATIPRRLANFSLP